MQKLERILVQLHRTNNIYKSLPVSFRRFTTDKPVDTPSNAANENEIQKNIQGDNTQETVAESTNLGGFAQSFKRYTASEEPKSFEKEASFATLLRHSNLMHLGDPEGKVVTGKVIEVINNDLYIDFGWKFHCVCTKPIKNNSDYVRGAKVRLRIKELELSTRFLGATKDVTLLEADCILLGLISTPSQVNRTAEQSIEIAAKTATT